MKKVLILSLMLFGFITATLVTSCEKIEEASPVTVKTDLTATIAGKVQAQLEEDTTVFAMENAPAGTKLFFRIAKQTLNPNAPSGDFLIYEATVDAAGFYSIEVPTAKGGGNVLIIPDEFTYDKTMWDWDNDENQWVLSKERKTYTAGNVTVNVIPGQTKIVDFVYNHN
jgi:hypothetical protein